jgi:hypothetical protein
MRITVKAVEATLLSGLSLVVALNVRALLAPPGTHLWPAVPYDMFAFRLPSRASGQLRARLVFSDGSVGAWQPVHGLLPLEHFRVASLVRAVLASRDPARAEVLAHIVHAELRATRAGRRRLRLNQIRRPLREARRPGAVVVEIAEALVELDGPEPGAIVDLRPALRLTEEQE